MSQPVTCNFDIAYSGSELDASASDVSCTAPKALKTKKISKRYEFDFTIGDSITERFNVKEGNLYGLLKRVAFQLTRWRLWRRPSQPPQLTQERPYTPPPSLVPRSSVFVNYTIYTSYSKYLNSHICSLLRIWIIFELDSHSSFNSFNNIWHISQTTLSSWHVFPRVRVHGKWKV